MPPSLEAPAAHFGPHLLCGRRVSRFHCAPCSAPLARELRRLIGATIQPMLYRLFVSCLLATSLVIVSRADDRQGGADEDRLARLERAMRQLEERNAELEEKVRRLEAQQTPRSSVADGAAKATATPNASAVAEPAAASEAEPPVVATAGASELKLTLGGFIQTQVEIGDVSAFEGRFPVAGAGVFGSSEVKDRFRVRRARLNVSGDYAEQVEFKLEGDFQLSVASGSTRTAFAATDLSANWHAYPHVNVKLGQFKAPFGMEQLTSDSRLFSIESSLVTIALAPERQIGVQLWGRPFATLWPENPDLLTYYLGMFNGNGRNTLVNDNSEFMYAGRLEVLALRSKILNEEATVRLGMNGLSSRDAANTSYSGALALNDDGSLSGFSLPTAGGREAYGFDATIGVGPFDLRGEYLNQRVYSREVEGRVPHWQNFRSDGYYVQGSYFVVAKKLQFVTKWESFNPGQGPDDDIQSVTAGLNYYIRGDDIKLLANYIHTWSDFRERNGVFGRSNFDEVILRLQVMF